MSSDYVISGNAVQGVGLRKLYHSLVDKHKANGIAVNDPIHGVVKIHLDADNNKRDKILKLLSDAIEKKTGHKVDIKPSKHKFKMRKVVLTPDIMDRVNKKHYARYIRSSIFTENDPFVTPLDKYKDDITHRYRLATKGDKLVGIVPDDAYKQLIGKQYPYKFMYEPVRTRSEALALVRKALQQNKQAAYAKGIQDKNDYGDLKKLKARQLVKYVLQKHYSDRNKRTHYDLRLGLPETGLYSWALPKATLPVDNQKLLAVRTQLHNYGYGDYRGVIPSGYGAGKVEMEDNGQAYLNEVSPDKVTFSVAHKKHPTRYKLVHTKDDKWLILNADPKGTAIIGDKPVIKAIDKKKLKELAPKAKQIQAKIDGAHTPVEITPKGAVEAYSIRRSKSGKPIVHTERLGLTGLKLPELADTVLRTEAFAEKKASLQKQAIIKHENGKWVLYTKDGSKVLGTHPTRAKALAQERAIQYAKHAKKAEVLPFNEVSGLLNSSVAKSIRRQQQDNIKMKLALLDIAKYKGKDVSDIPYEQRRELLEQLLSELPGDTFVLPEKIPVHALDKKLKQMSEGKHPQTSEGVVLDNKYKYKIRPDATGYFKGTFAGKGNRADTVGGILYSSTKDGPIAGKLGTGFAQADLYDIVRNSAKYINRPFRFTHRGKTRSGNFREPAFDAWETDK